MAKKQNQATVKVRDETYDQIRFLSDKSGLSKTQLLSEVIGAVFQIACTYDSINYEYSYDISSSEVTVSIHGKNRLVVKEEKMPKEILEEEAKAPVLEVVIKPKKDLKK